MTVWRLLVGVTLIVIALTDIPKGDNKIERKIANFFIKNCSSLITGKNE